MKKLKLKLSIIRAISLLFLCFIVSGCLEPGYRLEQSIKEAVSQAKEGDAAAAINKLESLQDKHPGNANVAEALGIAYEERGNYLLASNYFQKASRLSLDKKYLQLNSARNLLAASRKNDASSRLQEYLDSFPEDGDAWLQLGRLQYELNSSEAAVDALTRGILLSDPDLHLAEDHLALGVIYLEMEDFPQADYYLNQALNLSDGSKTESKALIGLIQSSVYQLDWDVADLLLSRLESSYPDVLLLEATLLLKKQVEDAQRKRSLSNENEQNEVDQISIAEEEPVVSPDSIQADVEPLIVDEVNAQHESDEMAESESEELDEVAAIESLDENQITTEAIEAGLEGIQDSGGLEVDVLSDVELDDGSVIESEGSEETEIDEPYHAPENESELLLIQAKQMILEGDYPKAIRMSWDSINRNPESPAAWFMLSYGYSRYGQYLNAESAALEAVRLNPKNKKIVFQYLNVLQRSRSAERFHEELLHAYHRFNRDPDFILALARSYARIKNDPENSFALYRRFLELEPDHERAKQVREEISFVE